MNRKGFASVIILVVIVVILVAAGIWYYASHRKNPSQATSQTVQAAASIKTDASAVAASTKTFDFDGTQYFVGDQLPSTGSDFTSESYEWISGSDTLDSWATLITTHKLSPLAAGSPISAEDYAQNVAAQLKADGAVLLEASVINTADAKAAGVDTADPPYLLVDIFPSSDATQPSELDLQKIQNGANGTVTSMIYAIHKQFASDAEVNAYLNSPEYAHLRQAWILAPFPY